MHRIQQDHGCVLLGGCRGTDERHLFSLALRLAEDEDVNHIERSTQYHNGSSRLQG